MNSTHVLKNKKGFSMLEVLLSVAIVAILFSIAVPLFLTLYRRNDADTSVNAIVQSLRRAQTLSQAVDDDTTWGVRVQSGSITLFRGASYAARETGFDETYDLAPTITPSGLQEVVYSKFSGMPQQTGTILLTLNSGGTRDITVNAKGTIIY